MAEVLKMSEYHYKRWKEFIQADSDTLTKEEQELLARLHSIYYKHSYYLPCTCSPKTYNTWIEQLNVIYNNGQ
jgi:hypothetical protein